MSLSVRLSVLLLVHLFVRLFPCLSTTKCIFFFIGASATKCFEKSRIFRYGLPKDILSKGQKTKAGGGGCTHGRKG